MICLNIHLDFLLLAHVQMIHSTDLSPAQMQVEISNAYNNIPSRPMPTASAKQLLRTTIHAGPQGLPPPEPRKPRNVIPFESILGKSVTCQQIFLQS